MTDEELVQFAALAKKYERDKDKEKVMTIVKDDLHEVFQEINDNGRSAANTAAGIKLEQAKQELTTQINNLKLEKADLDTKITELESKQPDIVKLRTGYENQVKELEKQKAMAEEKLKKTEDTLTQTLISERLDRDMTEFERHLTVDHGIDPEYAHQVLSTKSEIRDRVLRDENNKTIVRKRGQTDIYLTPTENKTAVQLLAEEVASNVADKWKTSKVKRGSGTKGQDVDNGGGGTGGDRSKFEAIRNEEKARTTQSDGTKRPSGHARLTGGV